MPFTGTLALALLMNSSCTYNAILARFPFGCVRCVYLLKGMQLLSKFWTSKG
jgi:hypothetical protein